jgi:hypothetical protein
VVGIESFAFIFSKRPVKQVQDCKHKPEKSKSPWQISVGFFGIRRAARRSISDAATPGIAARVGLAS